MAFKGYQRNKSKQRRKHCERLRLEMLSVNSGRGGGAAKATEKC